MPIYEYGCQNCNHIVDVLQKISDAPLTDCPECGQSTLKRLISAPRFRLKGQGWYETDFKKENQRNLHGERESSDAKPEKSSDTGSAPEKSPDKKSSDKTSSDTKSSAKTSSTD